MAIDMTKYRQAKEQSDKAKKRAKAQANLLAAAKKLKWQTYDTYGRHSKLQ